MQLTNGKKYLETLITIKTNKMDNIQLQTIKEAFGRVLWSHKVHEKQAEVYECQSIWLDGLSLALTAFTAGSLLYVILDTDAKPVVSAILSFFALLVRLFSLGFNPKSKFDSHKNTAKGLWAIKEKYIYLISDIYSDSCVNEQIITQRNQLFEETKQIYNSALATSNKAYKLATTALKVNDEHTFYEKEVDKFLPFTIQ